MIHKHGNVAIGIDSIGGNITSFQYEGKHIFLPQQVIKEDDEWKIRGGSHICFPNYGDFKETGSLKLPRHGFIRDSEMELSKRHVDEVVFRERFSISEGLSLEKNFPFIQSKFHCSVKDFMGHSDKRFPFSFQMFASIYFLPDGFLQSITICHPPEMEGDIQINDFIPKEIRKSIPIGLGLHPYFNIPDCKASLGFKIVASIDESSKIQDLDITDQKLNMFLGHMPNNEVVIRTHGFKAKVTFGGLFTESSDSQIVLWRHAKDSPYLCIEPIVSNREDFNTPKGVYLPPEKDYVNGWMMVRIEK